MVNCVLIMGFCVRSLMGLVGADPAIYRPTEDSVMRLSSEKGLTTFFF